MSKLRCERADREAQRADAEAQARREAEERAAAEAELARLKTQLGRQ